MRMRNRSVVAALSTMKFLAVVCIFLLPCLSDCQGKAVLEMRACGYAIISLFLRVFFSCRNRGYSAGGRDVWRLHGTCGTAGKWYVGDRLQ